jgi:hypothetical protein
MKIAMRKLSTIKPYERNPRVNDNAVEAVARSIQEFGFRQPIVVDAEGVIVCGHTRFKAALQLGLDQLAWEPRAGDVGGRINALDKARARGLRTWLSVEPVIEPDQALGVIRALRGRVDTMKIGKLNHDREREALVDWRAFGRRAAALCDEAGQFCYLKRDLTREIDGERYCQPAAQGA